MENQKYLKIRFLKTTNLIKPILSLILIKYINLD